MIFEKDLNKLGREGSLQVSAPIAVGCCLNIESCFGSCNCICICSNQPSFASCCGCGCVQSIRIAGILVCALCSVLCVCRNQAKSGLKQEDDLVSKLVDRRTEKPALSKCIEFSVLGGVFTELDQLSSLTRIGKQTKNFSSNCPELEGARVF